MTRGEKALMAFLILVFIVCACASCYIHGREGQARRDCVAMGYSDGRVSDETGEALCTQAAPIHVGKTLTGTTTFGTTENTGTTTGTLTGTSTLPYSTTEQRSYIPNPKVGQWYYFGPDLVLRAKESPCVVIK
jgi:hypothetical protein